MLYNKAHFSVRHAACTDKTRPNLNGVHFKSDGSTEATNGHILIRAKVATEKAEDFPTVPGMAEQTDEPLEEFICPVETVERIRKALPTKTGTMPILGNAILDVARTNANNHARFFTTDLESGQEVNGLKVDGEYPKTDQVVPKPPEDGKPTFGLDLRLVEKIIRAAKEFKGTGARNLAAKFYVTDEVSPIRIVIDDPDVGEMEAVIMPMRI